MTLNAAREFFTSNLLDELKLEPSWEKIRRYLFYACVAISVFATYNSYDISVECLPGHSNGTVSMNLVLRSRHVNKYCGNSPRLLPVRYAGHLLQFTTIWISVVTSYWLYLFPETTNSFRTFAKFCDAVVVINRPLEKIGHIKFGSMMRQLENCDPGLSTQVNDKIEVEMSEKNDDCTEALQLLAFIDQNNSVARCYFWRNIWTSISLVLISSSSVAYGVKFVFEIGDVFECDYNLATSSRVFVCLYGERITTCICTFLYGVCLLLQLCSIGWGMVQVKPEQAGTGKLEFVEASPIIFMLKLWNSSHHSHSGLATAFITILFTDDKNRSISSTSVFETTNGTEENTYSPVLDPAGPKELDGHTEKGDCAIDHVPEMRSSNVPEPSAGEDEPHEQVQLKGRKAIYKSRKEEIFDSAATTCKVAIPSSHQDGVRNDLSATSISDDSTAVSQEKAPLLESV